MVRAAVLARRGFLRPGREYAIELAFARPLTREERSKVLWAIRAEAPKLEREHRVRITGVEVRPDRAVVRLRPRVMTLLPLVVWGIIAAIVAVGIAIAAWKTSEAVPQVPWELLAPVGVLGAAALLVYAMSRG